MGTTNIPYADKSWNVTVGCTQIASGCRSCWAKDLHDKRHKAKLAGKKVPQQYSKPFSEIYCMRSRLNEPLHVKKPSRFFVCSMSDLFHPLVSDYFLGDVFEVIRKTSQHTYLIFTKRVKRMAEVAQTLIQVHGSERFKHVQWIVSCSTQKEVDENVPILLQIPAAVRGISLEPLIEEIDLPIPKMVESRSPYTETAKQIASEYICEVRQLKPLVQWVIVRCESGKNRRPCKTEWVRKIIKDCQAAGVSIYVKQLDIDGKVVTDINKFPEDLRIREYPHNTGAVELK